MNRFEIKGPTFRHSDLKLIGRRINIEKIVSKQVNDIIESWIK